EMSSRVVMGPSVQCFICDIHDCFFDPVFLVFRTAECDSYGFFYFILASIDCPFFLFRDPSLLLNILYRSSTKVKVRTAKNFSKYVGANKFPTVFNEKIIKKTQSVMSVNLRQTLFAFKVSTQIKNTFNP